MKVEKIGIDEVIPYENNAKLHPQEQIDQIKQSILEFGNNDPIAIDQNNIIIEGHGRLLALKELGYKEVEVIRLSHLTEEQRKAYTLVHNKLTMNSDFDMDILMEELKSIQNIDMSDYDFDINIEDFTEAEVTEDGFDVELPKEPVSKRGQVYQLGDHRLMVGDSTNPADVEKLMNGQKADLLFTDPPYNVAIENSQGMSIENDDMSSGEFKEFLCGAFRNAYESLKPGGAFYIWFATREHVNFETALNESGLQVRQELVWVKNSFTFGRSDYKWKHEPCLYGWKEGSAHYFVEEFNHPTVIEDEVDLDKLNKKELKEMLDEFLKDAMPSTVIHENKPLKNDLHPTMKPLKLCGDLIRNSSRKNEIVLDLFGGSGSTMMACEQLNRTCYMMEYDPQYADVIINRYEQLTGNKAVLINEEEK